MTTGTEITVTGEVRGIGPWSAGSAAAAPRGEDLIAATVARNMIGGGRHRLATAATKGAESGNERDTGTGRTADHRLWKGPTKRSIRDPEGAMAYQSLLNRLDAQQNYLGRLLKIQILGPHPQRI